MMGKVVENKAGYKKTKLGWIPEDWEVLALEQISKKIMVGIASAATHAYRKNGIVLIRNQNIKEGYLDDSNLLYIDENFELSHKNKRLKTFDLITARTGYPGTTCIVPKKYELAQSFTTLITRPNLKIVDSRFLCFYINSEKGQNYFESTKIGGGQKNVNASSLSKLPTPLPPLPEQKKIAEILSTWDNAIADIQSLITQLEQRKKGLMQQLLTGKKRLPGFEGEWKNSRLGDFFEERKETNHINHPLLSIGKNGVYPQDTTEKKDTSNKDKTKYKRIMSGDIGYNTMRLWQGRSALSKIEGIVSPAYTIVKPKENCNSEFFSYLFKLEEVIHKFYRNSQGMVSDTWMCKFKDFSIVKFKSPTSLPEQTAIANVLTAADLEINQYTAYLNQLKNQKKGLMQELLTGKTRVKTT